MVLPGHLAGGYLVTRAVFAIFEPNVSMNEAAGLFILGTLAGDLPDIDLLFNYFDNKFRPRKAAENHRNYITHAPLFWLIFCAVILLVGFALQSVLVQTAAILIFGGSWCHFLFDSLEYGVMWLWPLSKKRFHIFSNPIEPERPLQNLSRAGTMASHLQFVRGAYLQTWTMRLEIFVTIVAIIAILVS